MNTFLDFEAIAQVCHEAHRNYCKFVSHPEQMDWHDAPEVIRDGMIAAVEFYYHHPLATAEDGHKFWMGVRQVEGWAYGPVKDEETRTHPCMVEWSELTIEHQAKDELVWSITQALLPYVGHVEESTLESAITTVRESVSLRGEPAEPPRKKDGLIAAAKGKKG